MNMRMKGKIRMESNKISIIVPVYKVERYLERCVNSLINQTYKNIEIILVEVGRALSRVGRPLESPLAVQGYDFFAIGFLRRQCQCGMIRLFVDADYNRILPVRNFLGAGI